ncbi:YggS family pyridoxal phosphate-dependent enzyme [candidate division KSB1 bacterium]|nr:YggS family pyridoxal phosphate-dependent enzyme [candidate division KSB1 bacterium]NIR70584.1 YggS family pyridoxal phosphate-dependent enzyme [candidate division KSB1 bacterium]NIS27720.1 YggS family pyridoxal phosphate-dependent enzyme [candidate division KSB1 bacterium]NIT74548.1 YggS family pyridoxal phosphate-dependent enzyme [candidate division KSB1 bacterium]NIU28373.1 YggS family pyridoxal phosphate-dependent enzyme [candidate division KSB1 bacterium]
MNEREIESRVAELLSSLPEYVMLAAAAKTRTPQEVQAAVRGGVKIVGYNYVQEAERMYEVIGNQVKWHMIGHLQRNKAKHAVELFDMIETIDSVRLAEAVDRRCANIGKVMPVLIEINSGREANKSGVMPEEVEALVKEISPLKHMRVQGLMTMGPFFDDPEKTRPYLKATKELFDRLSEAQIENVQMRYLSMGMSDTYEIAIEEGANIVRIGTRLFGERPY